MLEWGDKLGFLRTLEQELGVTPKALEELPKLDVVQLWYLGVFRELNATRQVSMAGGRMPISLQERLAYVEYYGIHRLDERARIAEVIEAVDSAYLEYVSKKDADKPKEGPSETKSGPKLANRKPS